MGIWNRNPRYMVEHKNATTWFVCHGERLALQVTVVPYGAVYRVMAEAPAGSTPTETLRKASPLGLVDYELLIRMDRMWFEVPRDDGACVLTVLWVAGLLTDTMCAPHAWVPGVLSRHPWLQVYHGRHPEWAPPLVPVNETDEDRARIAFERAAGGRALATAFEEEVLTGVLAGRVTKPPVDTVEYWKWLTERLVATRAGREVSDG